VAVVGLLVAAGPAGAVTLVGDDGQVAQPYQRWAERSLVPVVGRSVVVHGTGSCPGSTGLTCAGNGEIWLVGYPGEWGRAAAFHELGHEFDFFVMTGVMRSRFAAIFGGGRRWWQDPSAPGEQFAEGYALCAMHATIKRRAWEAYDYRPTPAQHRRVCALIRRAGGWVMHWPSAQP
jgi:hypothetical protein